MPVVSLESSNAKRKEEGDRDLGLKCAVRRHDALDSTELQFAFVLTSFGVRYVSKRDILFNDHEST